MSTTSVMGGAVRRREDPALIRGTGVYTDDIKLSGALHVAFVRSPIARGKITRIDTKAAMQMPGVWAVYTAADVRHLGPLLAQVPAGKLRPLLADGLVNHVGEAVAMVVADSPYLARDAIEAVVVDYDSMPAVVDLKEAASDKVLIHADLKANTTVSWKAHDWWAGVIELDDPRPGIEEAKKRKDAVIVSLEMTNQRLIPVAIEPRSVIAEWNLGYGRFTVWSSTQVPHALMGALAKTFGLPSNSVRVIALEVGGGIRIQAQRLHRRGAGLLCRPPARTSGQVHRDQTGSCGLHHPGPGLGGNCHPRRNQGREDPRIRAGGVGRHGGLYPELHPSNPAAGPVGIGRPVRHPHLLEGRHRLHQYSGDRRLPGGGEAGSHLLHRADRRRFLTADRYGPGRGSQAQLPQDLPSRQQHRADHRQRQLRREHR